MELPEQRKQPMYMPINPSVFFLGPGNALGSLSRPDSLEQHRELMNLASLFIQIGPPPGLLPEGPGNSSVNQSVPSNLEVPDEGLTGVLAKGVLEHVAQERVQRNVLAFGQSHGNAVALSTHVQGKPSPHFSEGWFQRDFVDEGAASHGNEACQHTTSRVQQHLLPPPGLSVLQRDEQIISAASNANAARISKLRSCDCFGLALRPGKQQGPDRGRPGGRESQQQQEVQQQKQHRPRQSCLSSRASGADIVVLEQMDAEKSSAQQVAKNSNSQKSSNTRYGQEVTCSQLPPGSATNDILSEHASFITANLPNAECVMPQKVGEAQVQEACQSQHRRKHEQNKGARAQTCTYLFRAPLQHLQDFGFVPKLIGHQGSKMKAIAYASGGKVRLRGRGSRFLEKRQQQEAHIPLQLCFSCQTADGFQIGNDKIHELLLGIETEFRDFCLKQELNPPGTFFAVVP